MTNLRNYPIVNFQFDLEKLPAEYDNTTSILAAVEYGNDMYKLLTELHSGFQNPERWKSPVYIITNLPFNWLEAATIFFSGCALGQGLYEWDIDGVSGYYLAGYSAMGLD